MTLTDAELYVDTIHTWPVQSQKLHNIIDDSSVNERKGNTPPAWPIRLSPSTDDPEDCATLPAADCIGIKPM